MESCGSQASWGSVSVSCNKQVNPEPAGDDRVEVALNLKKAPFTKARAESHFGCISQSKSSPGASWSAGDFRSQSPPQSIRTFSSIQTAIQNCPAVTSNKIRARRPLC